MRREHTLAIDKMTSNQQRSFFNYLYTGFSVNTWLQGRRMNSLMADTTTDKEYEKYARTLFGSMKHAPLLHPNTTIYRGMRVSQNHPEITTLKPGTVLRFMEYGFVSTSTNVKESFDFAKMVSWSCLMPSVIQRINPYPTKREQGVLIKYTLGPGIRGLLVPKKFDHKWTGDDDGFVTIGLPDQDEIILPPGYTYTLKEVRTFKRSNRAAFIQQMHRMIGTESYDIFAEWSVEITLPKSNVLHLRKLMPCTNDTSKSKYMQTLKFGRNLSTLQCEDGQPVKETMLATLTFPNISSRLRHTRKQH